MSELKAYDLVDVQDYRGEVYLKKDVDDAIAELKAKLEAVNELVKESKELLKESQKMHQRCADNASKQIRRLKRALYKVCANWADVVAFEETEGIGHDNSMAERWRKMERKCLKKAEEYK